MRAKYSRKISIGASFFEKAFGRYSTDNDRRFFNSLGNKLRLPESTVLKGIVMGSAGGIHQLIDTHYQDLYRYAYRLTGSASDAEDLTQETFGKAIARLSQLREIERARSWLFKILRNVYLHRVRDEKRLKLVSLDSVDELPCREDGMLPEIDPVQLQTALNDLDESFRTPIILYYFEDFSYRDIADQMNLPIGTVMSRLARGKLYLKSRLTPQAPT